MSIGVPNLKRVLKRVVKLFENIVTLKYVLRRSLKVIGNNTIRKLGTVSYIFIP